MDPNQSIYTILNISKLLPSLIKKIILEYSHYFEKGSKFHTLVLLDQHFDKELLLSFKKQFSELSYCNDSIDKVMYKVKKYFQDSKGKQMYEFLICPVYTSDLPGNGKSYRIQKDIEKFEQDLVVKQNPSMSMTEFHLQSSVSFSQKSIREINTPKDLKLNLDHVNQFTEYVLLGGEISEAKLKNRLKKILVSRKQIRHLIIKIDYMENLLDRGYLLNDCFFKLCYFKCFFIGNEPHFLPESVQIKFEIQNYLHEFLYRQIPVLHMIPKVHSRFDLGKFDFSLTDPNDPVQSTCFFIDRVIKKGETRHFHFAPFKNHLNKFNDNEVRKGLRPNPLDRKQILKILEDYFIANPQRKGSVTFSNLMLFCKMASNEFRNLNHNTLLDDEVTGEIKKD